MEAIVDDIRNSTIQNENERLPTNEEESSLSRVIRPAFYMTRLFGLAPYSLPKNIESKRRPRVHYLYSFLPLCLYTYLVGRVISVFEIPENYSVTLGTDPESQWSKFFIAGYALIFSRASMLPMMVNYVVLLVEIVRSILTYEAFMDMWIGILSFDRKFSLDVIRGELKSTSGHTPLINEFKFYMWTTAFVSFIGWGVLSGTSIIFNHDPILNNLGYMLPYYGTYIAVSKFCGLALLIGQRFKYLNESTLASIDQEDFEHNDLEIIKTKEAEHRKLLEISETLNQAFTWSLALHLFSKFCHTVNNMYAFLRMIVNEGFHDIGSLLCLISWASMSTMELWALHSVCEYISQQANRFHYILLRWYETAAHKGLCEINSTAHLLLSEIHFTAGGCFNVDMKNFVSVIEYATTFLVILLQMNGLKQSS